MARPQCEQKRAWSEIALPHALQYIVPEFMVRPLIDYTGEGVGMFRKGWAASGQLSRYSR